MTDQTALESLTGGKTFLNDLQEGVWVADSDDQIVFANKALAQLLGYPSAEVLIGTSWHELFPEPELNKLLSTRSGHGTRQLGAAVMLGRSARAIPVNITVSRRTVEKRSWFLATVTAGGPQGMADSTSRQVMENSVDGICIIEGRDVTYTNRRFEELTGYTAAQVRGLGLDRIVHAKYRTAVAQSLADPKRQLVPVHHEVRIINRTGREVDCELRLVTVESAGRTVVLCFLRDVTQLRAAERIRTDLVAMLSHDLRTPLASIKEAISLLFETAAGKLEDRQRRYLTIAREEIDRLNRMIDNLIDVSRIEAGKVELRLDGVDLSEVISTSVQSMSLLVSKKNLTIDRNLPARIPLVMGDRDRLLRVFNNLLDNAIKYSPVGGTIRVEIAFVDPDAPVLSQPSILPNTGYVQVTVTDSGPGIPAEFLDRIFGKFERVDPHGPGIGLGLANVRSLVELHHGKVWAHSKLGEGAGFSFILPIKEGA
ncbi:MAG: PAS domain S-box protein [bacterium]